jgi:hypothetical protein
MYKKMSKRQLIALFEDYRGAFPEWNVEHEVTLTRTAYPVKQCIAFEATRSGDYRIMCFVEVLLRIPGGSRLIPQRLNKHRLISGREHAAQWKSVVEKMREEFKPRLFGELHAEEVLALAEDEAHRDKTFNIAYLAGLAALNAYFGDDMRAKALCEEIDRNYHNLGRPPAEWEQAKVEFAHELRDAIRAGCGRKMLSS